MAQRNLLIVALLAELGLCLLNAQVQLVIGTSTIQPVA